ncbi:Exoglucanase 1 [Paramyrothecium foliicola]|nr:Exoglucanase 1 [Paramyrothecium foliicola]
MNLLSFLILLVLCRAQHYAEEQAENHPKLSWQHCDKADGCQSINASITVDSNWRWLHKVNGYENCFEYGNWNDRACNSTTTCTEGCALDGATYKDTYGIQTKNSSISMQYKTLFPFAYSVNSRVFLMEAEDRYQMFTLLNNEIAVDVNLASVECGLNAALYFVAMEPDGGKATFPTNKAGAKFGTGYCDASCPRSNRFNGGRANYDNWIPSETDPYNGEGHYGACCSEFDVLNSNAHSYLMSSKPCKNPGYEVCDASWCDPEKVLYGEDFACDKYGCEYQPYRLGNKDFYGRGKILDTGKPFTVVTRFEEERVTQFFIQDGKKIEVPSAQAEELPDESGLSKDYCRAKQSLFDEPDRFDQVGGFSKHQEAVRTPMVLTMAITDDHWAHNLWLDSIWTPELEGQPGSERGPCVPENNDPAYISANYGQATGHNTESSIMFRCLGAFGMSFMCIRASFNMRNMQLCLAGLDGAPATLLKETEFLITEANCCWYAHLSLGVTLA